MKKKKSKPSPSPKVERNAQNRIQRPFFYLHPRTLPFTVNTCNATMLLTSQRLIAHSPFSAHSLSSTTNLYLTRSCNLSFSTTTVRPHHHCPILHLKQPFKSYRFTSLLTYADPYNLGAYETDAAVPKYVDGGFNFDDFLSLLEFSCLLSSTIVSIGVAVIAFLRKELLAAIGNRVAVWGISVLVTGVLCGAWIRRRQWRRVCREMVKDGLELNLLERVEKLEENLRSTATVVRVLSRQFEKLGIKFRVTRKTLKEPITETATLAHKNSEAARALEVQSEILAKELGEIQQVLLAMQEQQRKQLDLILAIGKTGKLWESKRETRQDNNTLEKTSNSAEDEMKKEVHQI